MTMPDHAAIQGTFADFKLIKSRSVLQIVVEVPIEHGEAVIKAFGVPQPGHEIPVAVARLVEGKAEKQKAAPKAIEPGRRWSELPRAQQAGIRCGEVGFQKFLSERFSCRVNSAEDAAGMVRWHCGVDGRSMLDIDAKAATFWDCLDSDYDLWLRHPELPPSDLKRSTGEAA